MSSSPSFSLALLAMTGLPFSSSLMNLLSPSLLYWLSAMCHLAFGNLSLALEAIFFKCLFSFSLAGLVR